jgi:2-oxoglutarate ferredoxin oxidoreductase subunit beta
MIHRAFEAQVSGEGFSFVEILTMCPTGWFIPTADGPDYMDDTLGKVHSMGELKGGR